MLTAKQEAFAQALASGKSQSDAYRGAYNCARMQDKAIWVRASEVAANRNVAGRVAELRAKLESKHLWTREMSVKVLGSIAAAATSKPAEKVAAVKELNAMHGFNEQARIESLERTRKLLDAGDGENGDIEGFETVPYEA